MKPFLIYRGKTKGVVLILVDNIDYFILRKYKWNFTQSKGAELPLIRAKIEGGSIVYLQRFIMKPKKDELVLRLNGPLDFRRKSLLVVDKAKHAAHYSKYKTPCSSIYKGVSWNKDRNLWEAYVCKGKKKSLGFFSNEVFAAKVYDKAATVAFGRAATLNFPESKHD